MAARSPWTLAAVGLRRLYEGRDGGKRADHKRHEHPDIFIVPKQGELDGDTCQCEQQEREQQPAKSVGRVIAHADKTMLVNAH